MSFFYNLLVTVAFVMCALLFALVFRQGGRRVHAWIAVMFVLFTFDNLLLYMDELMPGFALIARQHRSAFLVASNISGLLITFDYDRIIRFNRNPGPHRIPWPFWGITALVYVILGVLGEQEWAGLLLLALRGVLPIAVIVLAMRHAEGDFPLPVVNMRVAYTLLFFQVANSIEMAAVWLFGFELVPGRLVTIEAMSIACIIWGVWYCVRLLGTVGKASLPSEAEMPVDAVAAVSERYLLTDRESQILGLLYEGSTNLEIAQRAFISEGTVKTHVHNIFQKTGCSNRTQLLRLVVDIGKRG